MRLNLKAIARRARFYDPGWVDRVLQAGLVQGGFIKIEPSAWKELSCRPWPQWAYDLAAKAQPGDRGLGDVLEREVGLLGSATAVAWWQAHVGGKPPLKPCRLNRRYPLPRSPAA